MPPRLNSQPQEPPRVAWDFLGNLERGDGSVGGLEAELVEGRLERLGVAGARVGRAADGVDVGTLLREGFLLQHGRGGRGDLLRVRIVVLELERLDLGDLSVLDGDADLGAAVLRVDGVARGGPAGAAAGAAAAAAAAAAAGA